MALSYTDIQVEMREISLKNRPKELYEVSKKGITSFKKLNLLKVSVLIVELPHYGSHFSLLSSPWP